MLLWALFGWRCPRHFVPGYDRTVPPGHFATGFSWMLFAKYLPARPVGTTPIVASLRDIWQQALAKPGTAHTLRDFG